MAKAITVGTGDICPKCSRPMTRRKPAAGKPVVYAYWDYCNPCGHVQHYAKARFGGKPVSRKTDRALASGPSSTIVGDLYDASQDDGSLPW